MEIKDAVDLLQKYHKRKCTLDERILVETFYMNQNVQTSDLSSSELEESSKRVFLRAELFSTPDIKTIMLSLHVIAITAAIAIVAGVWTLLFLKIPFPVNCTTDISSGPRKAILTLANRTKINLSDEKSGSLLNQSSGSGIMKAEDGSLIYKVVSPSSLSYDTSLKVDRGEQKMNMVGDAYFEVYKVKSVIGRRA